MMNDPLNLTKKSIPLIVVQCLIGLFFLSTGILKIIDPLYFKESLQNSIYNDFYVASFLTFVIPILEIGIGLVVISFCASYIFYFGLTILVFIFTIVLFFSYFTYGYKDCGCLGKSIQLPFYATILKNVVIMVACIFLFKHKISASCTKIKKIGILAVFFVLIGIHGYHLGYKIADQSLETQDLNLVQQSQPKKDFQAWVGKRIQETPLKIFSAHTWKHKNMGLFFFSPTCQHCLNVTLNVMDLQKNKVFDTLIAFSSDQYLDALQSYYDVFQPKFSFRSVPLLKLNKVTDEVPVLFIIIDEKIFRVYTNNTIPCYAVYEQSLH